MSASALVACQYGAWYACYQQLAPPSIIIPLSEGFAACLSQVWLLPANPVSCSAALRLRSPTARRQTLAASPRLKHMMLQLERRMYVPVGRLPPMRGPKHLSLPSPILLTKLDPTQLCKPPSLVTLLWSPEPRTGMPGSCQSGRCRRLQRLLTSVLQTH